MQKKLILTLALILAAGMLRAQTTLPDTTKTFALTCAEAQPGQPNQWIAFRKDVTLDEVPAEAIVPQDTL